MLDELINHLQTEAFRHLNISDHQLDLSGWISPEFDKLLEVLCDVFRHRSGLFLEVGTWRGLSTSRFAARFKSEQLAVGRIFCVDTWLGAPEFVLSPYQDRDLSKLNGYPTVFYTFTRNMKLLGHDDIVVPFPMSSIEAARVLSFSGAKFLSAYIDAAHEYRSVKNDLESYFPLIENGGVLCGDDYEPGWSGVIRAVDEFVDDNQLKLTILERIWFIRKE
jgi:Methyltransferase domain